MIYIYNGYLRGNGKHVATLFKNGEKLLAYNTVRKNDSFVGVLDDECIMIDVDYLDDVDTLLDIIEERDIKCSVLETDVSMHFYFKGYDITANKIKWYSNIGILIDYKLGIRNTVDPLKIDGRTRRWLKIV